MRPIEATCDELAEAAEAHGLCTIIHRFSELLPGQGLREHAAMAMDPPGSSQSTVGPWMEVWDCGRLALIGGVASCVHTT